MECFERSSTPLAGLVVVQRRRAEDQRGFFSRLFCAEQLAVAGFRLPVAQINQTLTRKRGTVRGMHFQLPPHCEDKYVSCLRGEIFDVAVDLRAGSPTFLNWHGEILSAQNSRSLLIPQGFAHGFQTLADNCELIYLHSQPFAPDHEGAIHVLDPAVHIEWPLAIEELSKRDSGHAALAATFTGIHV